MEQISIVIYHKLETLVEAGDPRVIHSKHKPINGLVPYAIRLAQGGQQAGMVDLIMRASGASRSNNDQTRLWDRIDPYISHIFDDSSPPSSNQAIILVSPYVLWNFQPYAESAVTARWVAAVSTVPCGGGEFVPSVVQKLLEIAADDSLRSCIPLDVWEWLKERPTLPPCCPGRRSGELQDVADHIRKLEEIEVLTSYFSLVWSEWETVPSWCLSSVRKDFDGIGVWGNRQDLVERLDHILGQLCRGLRYLEQHDARIDEDHVQQRRKRYGELKEELLEVDRGAMDTLTRMPLELIFLNDHTDSVGIHRIILDLCLCFAPSVIRHSEWLMLPLPLHPVLFLPFHLRFTVVQCTPRVFFPLPPFFVGVNVVMLLAVFLKVISLLTATTYPQSGGNKCVVTERRRNMGGLWFASSVPRSHFGG